MITRLGRIALYCYSVITVSTGCIRFFKVGGNGGRGRFKNKTKHCSLFVSKYPTKAWQTSPSLRKLFLILWMFLGLGLWFKCVQLKTDKDIDSCRGWWWERQLELDSAMLRFCFYAYLGLVATAHVAFIEAWDQKKYQDLFPQGDHKVSPLVAVVVSTKWCGYEFIYFLTNLSQAKAFFLYQFGK